MSSRNPKRSSRLAAKEDSGDTRKRGRGQDESPEASPVAAAKVVPSSPATRTAEAAAPQRERRGAHAAGDLAPGAHAGDSSSPVVRASQHPAGVSAAQAASARKEASFNAQLQQQQQQQSRPSGGSHSARRTTEASTPHHHAAASPHAAHNQQRVQQPVPPQQQQQQHRASAPGGQGHMVPASYSQAHAQQAHMQAMAARQQQYAHHPGMQGGAPPASSGYMAANGRRGHPEGVAGEGLRTRGDGSGQVLPGHHGHHHHGQVDPRTLGGHGHHVHQTAQQQSLTEDLRKGLGGAVERWISARNLLPGEDSARFPSEIQRLVGLIAFEACDRSKGEEEGVEDLGDGSGGGVCRTETTTTRFRLAHPEVKVPFTFEATNHFFTGSLVGTEHRIESLRWKVDFELVGFLILALHTQSYEMGEEVARQKLNEVRQLLNTHISSSELGVFLMLAGNACRGASAWNDVEEVCFWTANFSLPEFRVV